MISLRRTVSAVGFWLLLGMIFTGCHDHCSEYKCDHVSSSVVSPQPSGFIQWGDNRMLLQPLPDGENSPISLEGVCFVGLQRPRQEISDGAPSGILADFFTIVCQRDDITLSGRIALGDLRGASQGALTPAGLMLMGNAAGQGVVQEKYFSYSLENASGGWSLFPQLVSSDFQRTVLVKGEIPSGKPILIHLQFNVTAADYKGEPGNTCVLCAG